MNKCGIPMYHGGNVAVDGPSQWRLGGGWGMKAGWQGVDGDARQSRFQCDGMELSCFPGNGRCGGTSDSDSGAFAAGRKWGSRPAVVSDMSLGMPKRNPELRLDTSTSPSTVHIPILQNVQYSARPLTPAPRLVHVHCDGRLLLLRHIAPVVQPKALTNTKQTNLEGTRSGQSRTCPRHY